MTVMPRIGAATASHSVPTGLGRLHAVECGSGSETIVLWPSIFTDHRIYAGVVERLAAQFRFLLIDGPAHGKSEGRAEEFTMEDCAAAMAQVMDRFGLQRAVIGGTSWGGIAAARLALAQPERAKALLLMNTPMEIDARRPGVAARLICAGARWMPGSAAFRNGVARSFFSPDALEANPEYARAFHSMLRDADPRALSAAIRSVMLRSEPLKPRMAEIPVPALVIAGKADSMYPLSRQEEAARLAPKGAFAAVGGRHISAVEEPDQVADLIGDFVARGDFNVREAASVVSEASRLSMPRSTMLTTTNHARVAEGPMSSAITSRWTL